MKYHELNTSKQKKSQHVGRGISAGRGKTAGRGTKGQNSRAGGRRRPGFEGGQTPLMQLLPKRRGLGKGSFSRSAKRAKVDNVYTGQLNAFNGKVIDNFSLAKAGLITNPYVKVKIIVKGELKAKVTVNLQGASKAAQALIQKAGGNFNLTPQIGRTSKNQTNLKN